jgi:hypothetical protein
MKIYNKQRIVNNSKSIAKSRVSIQARWEVQQGNSV